MAEVKEHLLHEVVRYQLAKRRQGHGAYKEPLGSTRWGDKALASERNGAGSCWVETFASMARWWNGLWSYAAFLCLYDAQKEAPGSPLLSIKFEGT